MAETSKKVLFSILDIFLLALIVLAGVKINNEIKQGELIGPEQIAKISVSGTGKVYAKPDLAIIDFSVITENRTVNEALNENTEKMNTIVNSIKNKGVEENDIKTVIFNISPLYEYQKTGVDVSLYPSGKRVLVGYEVTQSLEVKIRDMAKIGEVIQSATDAGANDVGNLVFTIENQDALKAQAKTQAIEEAKANAQNFATQLGVNLVRIIDFSENTYTPTSVSFNYLKQASESANPQIETGENEIESVVTLTYEIK